MAQTTGEQDPVKVDSGHYSVEHEDDRVRVLRIRYGAREQSVMHSHPACVIVSMTDQDARFTLPGGKTMERHMKAGEVGWAPAETHLPENLSDSGFEAILIEVKG